ncbi:MAG TPA: cytochrome ubiquinol oxidase subunit I [Candidatus Limnocylindrales bacterium]|nr:cytochrome ubiquinol oxidase subunit I [Candidatus Limnocylindrales bacterium]
MSAALPMVLLARALDLQLPPHSPSFGGLAGYRIAIGVIMSIHILLSGLVSGATQLGPLVEWLGYMRQRPRYDRLAHGLARFSVYYFAIGATTAILFMTVLVVGLWGHFFTELVRVTWWPFFIEAWTFLVQVALTYLWYYTWERMRRFKVLHMALGGMLVIASILQVTMIDIVASYMLTPGNPADPLRIALNPTAYALNVHRLIANIAYIGFGIAGLSAILYRRSKNPEDHAFYDWAGSFGMLWGMSLTILQPVVGYSYAKEIQLHSYAAWFKMMQGDLSTVFVWQIFLLGMMYTVGVWYFTRRLRRAGAPGASLLRTATAALLVLALFAAQPYHLAFTQAQVVQAGLNRPFWEGGLINPLGAMIPNKVLALMGLDLVAIVGVVWYLRGLPAVVWGAPGRPELRMLLASGVMVMMMIVTMGFIREDSRVPYLVTGQVTVTGQQDVSTPLPAPAPQPSP